ncbi:UDP-N-acetylmuramoyl-L-alanine--D-glutamate ligase [Legionella waltersii]|uniref:UDP-N-acetylmuramoylalanine--D-glutamate ligase n=1 Tax=Legionella waltersii TaxID=66969 RepID=A0A0W1AD65_9GAMM|nr:UDP-N-acetylmuramoyl-L-alanine--D-glutamate ligase [Legionella waltersii]KTD79204.1 UDP-N-acetylmuramoyl-L-alanyl-D-glutamate synthetase [Legionella waltersii]SNV12502.1 UDP-N-acetylmuramoylalanine--D-glutamate ligase [Legionella waltersii]
MTQSFYLVAGLGKTGLSIARYLKRNHKNFIAYDTRKEAPGLAEFSNEFPDTAVYLETVPDEVMQGLTDVIASPGLPLETPVLVKARQIGAEIYGDVECLAREIDAPVVAITGTNGKSTVTTLVGEMAKAAGFRVAVAGNIGTPVLDMLDDEHHYDLWVLELSSFQLDLTHSLSPVIATILNVTDDHLDRHHTFEAYVQAKQRIYKNAQYVLYNREDASTPPAKDYQSNSKAVSFGKDAPLEGQWGLIQKENTYYLAKGKHCFLPVDSVLIKGVHNWLNALASCALADAVGISEQKMIQVLTSFKGLPHRCQWVRRLDGVDWINDSKGTNVGATISAINGIGGSMQGKIVLIAGGQGKGADFSELQQSVSEYVRTIVLIGVDADKIESALSNAVPIHRAESLDSAVEVARTCAMPGDVVLLSPACASLDMFRDFNHRGDVFTSTVSGL